MQVEHLKTGHVLRPHWAVNTTTRCQQRCVYCFEGDRAGYKDLDADTVKGILQEAAAEVPAVVFMGAEPTMHRDLPALIAYATEIGLDTSISTNGLRFSNRTYLERLIDAGLNYLEMSFPYPDASTYSAITRQPEKFYNRLIEALANIDATNSGSPGIGVNINVVVSRFNVMKLEQVLSTLDEQLSRTSGSVTFKWITPIEPPDARYLTEYHVPASILRDRFTALLTDWRHRLGPIFRSVPLCCISGYEYLSANVLYYTNNTHVRSNFFGSQTDFRDMHPERVFTAPYKGICGTCQLSPICYDRTLFEVSRNDPENRPISSETTPAKVLAHLGELPAKIPVSPSPTAEEALAIRVHRALVDNSSQWTPVIDHLFDVAHGDRVLRLWVGEARSDYPNTIPVAKGLVAQWKDTDDVPLAPILRYVLEWLGDEAASEDPLACLANSVVQKLTKSANDAAAGIVAVVEEQILLETTDRRVLTCRLRPIESGGEPAFLCGGVVLAVDPGLLAPVHPALELLASLVSRMSTDLADETTVWIRQLWKRLGSTLLPHSGDRGAIIGGRVARDCVSLKIRSDGQDWSLVFRPKDETRKRSFAVVGDTSVSHEQGKFDSSVSRILAGYIQKLKSAQETG